MCLHLCASRSYYQSMSGQNKLQIFASAVSIPVAVVAERRRSTNPWLDEHWRIIALALDPPEGIHGRMRERDGDREEYFLACPPIELHPKEAEGYSVNLAMETPVVWIVTDMENDEPDDPMPLKVQLVTVSAFDAQEYLDPGELQVDVLPMPEDLLATVTRFVAAQPAPAPFRKRKNKRLYDEQYRFGKEPIASLRQRMKGKEPQ